MTIDNTSVVSSIALDVGNLTLHPLVLAKQNDTNKRYVEITLFNNGVQIPVTPIMECYYRCLKPDGTNATGRCEIQNNKIYLCLDSVILSAPGRCEADVYIIGPDTIISSSVFSIKVERMPLNENHETGSETYSVLYETLLKVENMEAEIEEALRRI